MVPLLDQKLGGSQGVHQRLPAINRTILQAEPDSAVLRFRAPVAYGARFRPVLPLGDIRT